ncbi:DNA-binding PadR family transcriptional regulator [Mycetocola sp. CAN_C7]|uniref:PadR family transcriptional regulator n=1 Tax=Mycetocola sp. CAN_C7 TaxID=2787724 RepID=UPI0018C9A8AF
MPTKPLAPLGIAVLGFLVERPMHPYEMYQLAITRDESRLMAVNAGSLYRAVYALDAAGHIRAVSSDRDGARPERTIFEITELGRRELSDRIRDLLAVPQREYPKFPVAVAEAHALPKREIVAALEQRLAAQRDDLSTIVARARDLTDRGVPQLYWIDVSLLRSSLSAEIEWIERTIHDLTSGALPWQHATAPDPHISEQK